MERSESLDSSSMLYKVMVNRKIVDKVQMNMHSNPTNVQGTVTEATCLNEAVYECNHIEEIETLTKENKTLEQKYKETFEALDKVRQTALETSERALSREFRIAYLEKALHGCEVSLTEANEQLKEREKNINQMKRDVAKELGVLQSQVERLNTLVMEKDRRILDLANDLARCRKELTELTQRKSDLLKQLKDMCEKLNTVVWETNQREKMLNNLESELKKREMERQAAFLSEVTRSKRLLVSIKVKENMLNKVISNKNQKIAALEQQTQHLIAKISRINGVFHDIDFDSELGVSGCTPAAICGEQGNVECSITSPCNMQLLQGQAKVIL
ncbi:TATA element modulatory factor, putative [Babesia ovis]|uniref:TATA element modulatory factor, putative n=1 Tax=Babesia ovis TaxID=5869 RepID=A0A9W5TAX8_BABOV|nr:TATA element modulatory factor, putative [Babesia ovis]